MPNMTVENLTRSVGTGDVESFMGAAGGAPPASERSVIQEMQDQGMETSGLESTGAVGEPGKATSFTDVLQKSLDQVNEYQHDSDTAIKELVAGRTKNIHETMLTIERADTSLKLMMQVRNKVLDAYREIMRMQV